MKDSAGSSPNERGMRRDWVGRAGQNRFEVVALACERDGCAGEERKARKMCGAGGEEEVK